MGKIIIQNDSSQGDYNAIKAVLDVVRDGRMSNGGKQYCFVSVFPSKELRVYTDITKNGTDKFIIQDSK